MNDLVNRHGAEPVAELGKGPVASFVRITDYGRSLAEGTYQLFATQQAPIQAAQSKQAKPDADPIRELITKHAEMLESGPYAHYCYFELAYTRHTGWMAWICSNQREQDPNRKILAKGQGSTPDEACRIALEMLAATSV